MARLAILKPKFGAGREAAEKGLAEFADFAGLQRFWLGERERAAGRRVVEQDRVLVVEFEVDEKFGIGDQQREELTGAAAGP